jgi:hypothetical protein
MLQEHLWVWHKDVSDKEVELRKCSRAAHPPTLYRSIDPSQATAAVPNAGFHAPPPGMGPYQRASSTSTCSCEHHHTSPGLLLVQSMRKYLNPKDRIGTWLRTWFARNQWRFTKRANDKVDRDKLITQYDPCTSTRTPEHVVRARDDCGAYSCQTE